MTSPSGSSPASVPVVRRIAAADWAELKAMRLEALADPAAPIAYLETHADALARPDVFWQERAAGAASGARVAQFVAVAETGEWVGAATGLREEPGTPDFAGQVIDRLQVHVVGVWVRPAHRGSGLLGRLVGEVAGWATGYGVDRLRLLVHEDNARAQAAYRKIGFTPTGVVVALEAGHEVEMVRRLG